MAELAAFLTGAIQIEVELDNRPVVDKTGLKGVYEFSLDYQATGGNERPDIFSALRDQLGLKLESRKEAAKILVIQHVERPSPD